MMVKQSLSSHDGAAGEYVSSLGGTWTYTWADSSRSNQKHQRNSKQLKQQTFSYIYISLSPFSPASSDQFCLRSALKTTSLRCRGCLRCASRRVKRRLPPRRSVTRPGHLRGVVFGLDALGPHVSWRPRVSRPGGGDAERGRQA